MLENTIFGYLDSDDQREFATYWPEDQDILVAGNKTLYRLEKYLPTDTFEKMRVILSALVYDFKLPAIRFTTGIALMMTTMQVTETNNASQLTKNILLAEMGLLQQNLMTDDQNDEGFSEKDLFEKHLKNIVEHWNQYLESPSSFSYTPI